MTPVPLLFIAAIHWLWKKVGKKKGNEETNDLEETAVKIDGVTGNSKNDVTAVEYKYNLNDGSPLMKIQEKRNILREISHP